MKRRGLITAVAGLAAAGAARAAYAALTRYPPGGEKTWTRANHRGEPVTLLEGPSVALGAIAIQFIYPERVVPTRTAQALALAGAGALGFGVYDDLAGSGKRRGLRGHLGALAHGEVTTGTVKLIGLGVTGVGSAVLMGGDATDVVINTGLIAGSANLLNLFDLRPGRAIKVAAGSAATLIAFAPGGTTPPVTPPPGGTPRPPSPPWPPRRVVTASGGNHGVGVATAARWLGVPATVYVPGTVPESKARRIAAAGADVVKTGSKYADAERAAREFAQREGLYYVHAYDDPAVVAGQGTVGLEIRADLPDCDVVAVPVGGGGLLAGVSGAIAPVHAIAVEPEGCPSLHAAAEAGEPVEVGADSVAASALGASRVGDLALAAYRGNEVGLALVGDAAIIAARDRLWEEFRLAVEPAAAVVFAAWLSGLVPGESPCLLLSGANTEWTPS